MLGQFTSVGSKLQKFVGLELMVSMDLARRASHDPPIQSPQLALYPSGVCGGVLGDMEEEAVNISCKPKPFRIQ